MVSRLQKKAIEMQLTFETILFGKIHYLTEINVNLLLNTCNFHRKFRLIFLLILSENAPNVDFREAKFQNFQGEHAPGPPSVSAPLSLDRILVGSTLYILLAPGLESYATYRLKILKQLLGYIQYCTEISEININLLPNTCNFHRNFRLIFSLHLSENAQNLHFREAKFQNFPGERAPGPPSLLAPLALDTICAGLTLNCFRRPGYFQSVILTVILRILRIQKDVSFLSKKGCTSRIVQIYILRTADMRSAQA